MGELAFGHLCASVGLTANRSLEADKTGWDYLVEFNFDSPSTPEISTIHQGALECKVQVKSTDKRSRKCSIKLSNLKRLATAAMPTFVLFIEFDGKSMPQRLFLVHFDQSLCLRVLSRIHDAESEGQIHRLNKLEMVIKYDEGHLLEEASGAAFSSAIKRYVGGNIAEYVTQKNNYLASAGLENGFAELTFTAVSDDTIQDLIDMSLGLDVETEVSDVEAIRQRFGMKVSAPFIKEKSVKISMPDVKPSYEGRIKFKLDKLGVPLILPAELYVSEFNSTAPLHMRKIRIKADFFEFVVKMHTSEVACKVRTPVETMQIRRLRDGLKSCQLLCQSENPVYLELDMPSLPSLKVTIQGPSEKPIFNVQPALDAVEAGLKVLTALNIDGAQISFLEATQKSEKIIKLEELLRPDACNIKFDFSSDPALPITKPAVFLALHFAPIGNILVGAFVTMTGKVLSNGHGNFTMISDQKIIERILLRERGEKISKTDLIEAGAEIRRKYEGDYLVLSSLEG
ncbi:hypothetical protein ASD07_10800 [Duganella sp. Root336D2]|nr:hypothetical protein ASD07_10800 [Duganella sp. Root336D2]